MKPILFNTEMVKVILADRKTVTRRVVKPKPICCGPNIALMPHGWILPYRPGDILYTRETWAQNANGGWFYKADGKNEVFSWKPSIHMPREAARIFLRVIAVGVERLQNIDEEGAKAEGANWRNGKHIGFEEKMQRSAIDRFAEIWDSTLKPKDRALYGWGANPWVWVIEFERISKEEAQNGP